MENNNLKRISNYAKDKGVSVQAIYKWIAKGKVQSVNIDGICYIVMDEVAENAKKAKRFEV